MNGYLGYSRSVRAAQAQYDCRFPLTSFTRSNIDSFLDDVEELEEFAELKDKEKFAKIPVSKWKYIAKNFCDSGEWHHTSSYFNKTKFYDLAEVLDYIIDNFDLVNDKNFGKEAQNKESFQYALIKCAVWGGTRKHPKIARYELLEGVINKDWFYTANHKKKINGNWIEILTSNENFQEYKKDFVKFSDGKSLGKRALDKIAKERLK